MLFSFFLFANIEIENIYFEFDNYSIYFKLILLILLSNTKSNKWNLYSATFVVESWKWKQGWYLKERMAV